MKHGRIIKTPEPPANAWLVEYWRDIGLALSAQSGAIDEWSA
jgi:hypothetical protein